MIKDDNNQPQEIEIISDSEKQKIIDFLQGAVYCWCKNKKNEWFALRDLMGGENFFWSGTPLMTLYEKHEKAIGDSDEAVKEAGKDAGWLLKKTIFIDKREFETKRDEYARQYKWTDKEENE